jgi:hypothetical protein
MKRALILAVGFLAVTAIAASAQTPTTSQPPARTAIGANFVDANGDGICDLYQSGTRQGQGQGKGKGYGRGNGTGTHVGPQDGSGYGAPAGAGTGAGTGICDGTGPKGKGRGPRR